MPLQKICVVPLHKYKEFMSECADILNEEWPRSKTARCHMLEKSNDNFPYNLVLLEEKNENLLSPVGHSRLCKVHGNSHACFIESVIISKKRRGEGLGRKLMLESELEAKRLGCHTVYLTTHDKQEFYSHIGYEYCEPIVSFGSASKLISDQMAKTLSGNSTNFKKQVSCTNPQKSLLKSSEECSTQKEEENHEDGPDSNVHEQRLNSDCEKLRIENLDETNSIVVTQPLILNPPPPPPPVISKPSITKLDTAKVFWMKKEL